MDQLQLAISDEALHSAAMDSWQEHLAHGEQQLHVGALPGWMDCDNWLKLSCRNASADTCLKQWVPANTFLVRQVRDKKLVGTVDTRHCLNDFCGNAAAIPVTGVRPIERGKRYATPILQLSRDYCRQLGFKRMLPGCDLQNGGSRRTSERDGRLEKAFGLPTPTGKRYCSTGSRYKQAPFYRVLYRRRDRWVSHPPHRLPPHLRFFRSQRSNKSHQSHLTGIFALALAQAHSGARR